ncbi:cobaltochelatase subunit CobN [Pseudomonas aeruginosa]|nr:cobaltochelatase subunit CobN [Pseudomonas aeruginosa]
MVRRQRSGGVEEVLRWRRCPGAGQPAPAERPGAACQFLALDVPVLQTLGYRDGNEADWLAAASGWQPRTAAAFLGMPETWGMSDPLVISARENGEPKLMARAAAEALLDKLDRLLRRASPAATDKHLALMF